MSTNSAHQTCNHPARDVTIVALGSAVVALVAVIAVNALDGGPLAALASGGSAFAAAFSVGMGVLAHLKRTA
ncbi:MULTISPECIES: hypothetical protein [Streptomyces violaceusniger group]|uniref:Uncharacterized protein n=2 Tax=Streptomyces javensis TaxID=114698 RepID=A0ABS0RIV6_9ACTN|nr:hypothetical protein [Streptomyces javensis]MBI0317358.1 hypothetical protein [Streptomyces javensis]